MLIFQRELAVMVIDGRKTETRRELSDNPRSPWFREGCAHEVGSRHAVVPGRSAHGIGYVVIDDVALVTLGQITHDSAVAEGFADVRDFMTGWEALNGTWNPRQRVWRVKFHVETDAERLAAA